MDSFLWAVIAVVLIMVIGSVVRAKVTAISQHSFKELASKLEEDNAHLKSELATVKETLSSINKMMKEVG